MIIIKIMEPKKKIKKFTGFSKPKEGQRYGNGGTLFRPTPVAYEPRRQYRYIMELPSPNGVIECWVNCEKPSLEVSREIPFMNTSTFIPRQEWQPIRVILRDAVSDDDDYDTVVREIMNWSGAVSNGQRPSTYKKNVTIQMIDPTGITVESWHLIGSFPSAVMMRNEYDDRIEVELTLHYDHGRLMTNTTPF
jgi:hypothetical protein